MTIPEVDIFSDRTKFNKISSLYTLESGDIFNLGLETILNVALVLPCF